MDKQLIIYYERAYFTFLKNSLAENTNILEWIEVNDINDNLENIVEYVYSFYTNADNLPLSCVMVSNRQIKEILYQMFTAMNVNKESILDVYKSYMALHSTKRYQRIIHKKNTEHLDGLVLGISHGMTGIVEERLPGKAINLCYSSQDLYFNFKTLECLYDEYFEIIKDIKYVVIDMFDYFYFNFDTILTGASGSFLEKSGFLCEHRNPWNKEITFEDINNLIRSMWNEGKSNEEQELFQQNFPFARQIDKTVYKELPSDVYTLTEAEILKYQQNPTFSSPQIKVYESTIQFQITNLHRILQLLLKINPKMRIFMVLLPKYYIVEEAETIINANWKPFFMDTINNFKNQYPFELIDLKSCEEFSKKPEYYTDLTHFNHNGACKFTDYLSHLLTKEYGLSI